MRFNGGRARRAALLPMFLAAALAGAQTLSLNDALAGMKAVLRWDPFTLTGTLVRDGHRVVFKAVSEGVSSVAVADGSEFVDAPSPYLSAGKLLFPEAFVSAVGAVFDRLSKDERSRFRIAAIIIDPGHGGKDTGAIGTNVIDGKKVVLREKDITLKVGLRLDTLLKNAFPDKRILMTRKTDVYPTLEDRVSIANSVPLKDREAIVFLSIHANASFNKNARGYEVWYLSPEYRRTVIDEKKYADSTEVFPILNAMLEEEFTTESIMIARSVLKRFDESVGAQSPSRGVKAEEWFVVRNARMPSVLVELGFVTNPQDARLLTDPAYLRKLSDALYKGIVDFTTMFERSGGFTTDR